MTSCTRQFLISVTPDFQLPAPTVPARRGLKAEIRGRSLQHVARDVLAIARKGLKARACLDRMGSDESGFLTMLDAIAETGRTPAEEMLESYHGKWRSSVDPLFDEYAY